MALNALSLLLCIEVSRRDTEVTTFWSAWGDAQHPFLHRTAFGCIKVGHVPVVCDHVFGL